MSLSQHFESYSAFLARRWKIILVVWVILLALTAPFAAVSQGIISYSVSIPASDKESIQAQNMISENFTGNSGSNSTVYVILEGADVLSPQFYQRVYLLNSSLFQALASLGLKNQTSIYSLELRVLNSIINGSSQLTNTTKNYLNDTAFALQKLKDNITYTDKAVNTLAQNISSLNSDMYKVKEFVNSTSLFAHYIAENLTSLNSETYSLLNQAEQAVNSVYSLASVANETSYQVYSLIYALNGTAQLIYGVPYGYISTWKQIYSNPNYSNLNSSSLDTMANLSYSSVIAQQPQSYLYYRLFYAKWYQLTFNQSPSFVNSQSIYLAEDAINSSAPQFISNLSQQEASIFIAVLNNLNLTDFNNESLIDGTALGIVTANQSVQQKQFVFNVFNLGAEPNSTVLDNFALQTITANMTPTESEFVTSAFSANQSSSLDAFVLNLVASKLPQLTIESELNMSPYRLVLYAFQLGYPPNSSMLEQETASIAANAMPDNLTNAIKNLGQDPYSFMIQVQRLGYPLNSTLTKKYIVSLFANMTGQGVDDSYIQLLTSVYNLGQNASTSSELQLAISFIADHMPEAEQAQLQKNFGLDATQFVNSIASIGYPADQLALRNLTISLAYTQLVNNNLSVVNNISKDLNESLIDFISKAYDIGYPQNSTLLSSYTFEISYKAIKSSLSQNPLFVVNESALASLLHQVMQSNVTAYHLLSSLPMKDMPVMPISGIVSQYVDKYNNATIITLTFASKPTDEATSKMEYVVESFNSPEFKTYYTSGPIIESQLQSIVTSSERVALPAGIAAAVLITGLFFMSPVAAFLPMLLFGISAVVGFGLIDIVIGRLQGQSLSFISPLVILILALGLITDYSVLLLNRFRQEMKRGKTVGVKLSTRWAGEAVFTSGITVVLSYIVLSLAGIPLFSDVGSANIIMVSSVLASSLTLLPSLMHLFGEKIFWPKKNFSYNKSRLARITKKAIARPKTILSLLLIFTAISSAIALTLPVNINILGLTPESTAKEGLDQITNNFGGNILTPTYVVVSLPAKISFANNTFNETELMALSNIAQSIREYEGVAAVYGPTSPYNSTSIPADTINSLPSHERSIYAASMAGYISRDNSSVYYKVQFSGDPYSNRVLNEAQNLSNTIGSFIPYGYKAYVGGGSLDSKAVLNYVFEVLPKIVLTLVAAIFVVLFFQLRSVFTPLRLISTILASVAWTVFFVWLIFYKIGGSSVFVFAPLFLVTTMLGLGMDYDIFLIVRVREEASKGLTDEESLIRTSESTAGVIAALGFILSSVFLALGLSSIRLLQQIGITLAIGILSDTFIVWLAFVPSIMILAKRLNWWPGDPRKEGMRNTVSDS
ncbi:MAG: MMPL family transporter [Nitrososphaerota archaeon]